MNPGFRIAVRAISRLIGLAVGFVAYGKYGIWIAIAAGLGASLLVAVALGALYGYLRSHEFIAILDAGDQDRDPK